MTLAHKPDQSRITEAEIERLVQSRKIREVARRIPEFLEGSSNPESIFLACDWYRRIGDFKRGLALVNPGDERPDASESKSRFHFKRKLWSARFLNMMGASELSLRIVGDMKAKTSDEHRILGNIYLTNYEYLKAEREFRSMLAAQGDESYSYLTRIGIVSLADCLAAQAQFKEAVALVRGILREATEPYLQAIAHQALGEYFAKQGHFKRAKRSLDQAQKFYPAGDLTVDYAFFLKWSAYVEARLGDVKKAKTRFAQGLALLRRPTYRPDVWLDLLRLKTMCGLATHAERELVTYYPGRPQWYSDSLGATKPRCRGKPQAEIEIGLDTNEYRIGEKRFLGLSSEAKLLGFVRATGSYGFSAEKAKALLWSDEPYSYPQLMDRTSQILRRIRTFWGIQITHSQGVLKIAPESLGKVCVRWSGDEIRPSFLLARKKFKQSRRFVGAEVSGYYQISRTQRAHYLNRWVEKGWITRIGKAPRFQYVISTPNTENRPPSDRLILNDSL